MASVIARLLQPTHPPPAAQYESFAALKKTGAAEFEVHVRAGGGSPTAWVKAGCVVSEGDATEAAIQYQRQLIIAHGLAMTPGLKVRSIKGPGAPTPPRTHPAVATASPIAYSEAAPHRKPRPETEPLLEPPTTRRASRPSSNWAGGQ